MISKFSNRSIMFLAIFLFGACNHTSDSVDDIVSAYDNNEPLTRTRAELFSGCYFLDNRRQDFGVSCNEQYTEGVRVENAGIILASSFIRALFDRLGLIRNNQFLDQESNKRAVMWLSYLGTGVSNFDNRYQSYLLNKILSGLDVDVDEEFGTSLEPSEEEKNLITGLIGAMISQWPIIGNSSVTAFRENWFVRSGILYETNNSWELVIERRPYDVLLSKNPHFNSIVNYPWMKKPLNIRWNY